MRCRDGQSIHLNRKRTEILNPYVQNNEKLNGFSVLIHYLKKTEKPLIEDATREKSIRKS